MTPKRWMAKLLHHLHTLTWSQWEHRNKVLYEPDQKVQQAAVALLKDHIQQEHRRGRADLPPRDHSYFTIPLLAILKSTQKQQKTWLINLTSARKHQSSRTAINDTLAYSPERDSLLHWCKTGRFITD